MLLIFLKRYGIQQRLKPRPFLQMMSELIQILLLIHSKNVFQKQKQTYLYFRYLFSEYENRTFHIMYSESFVRICGILFNVLIVPVTKTMPIIGIVSEN